MPIDWTSQAEKAFQEIKEKLSNATLLAHPVPGASYL